MSSLDDAKELVNRIYANMALNRNLKLKEVDSAFIGIFIIDELIEEVREYCDDNFLKERLNYYNDIKIELLKLSVNKL